MARLVALPVGMEFAETLFRDGPAFVRQLKAIDNWSENQAASLPITMNRKKIRTILICAAILPGAAMAQNYAADIADLYDSSYSATILGPSGISGLTVNNLTGSVALNLSAAPDTLTFSRLVAHVPAASLTISETIGFGKTATTTITFNPLDLDLVDDVGLSIQPGSLGNYNITYPTNFHETSYTTPLISGSYSINDGTSIVSGVFSVDLNAAAQSFFSTSEFSTVGFSGYPGSLEFTGSTDHYLYSGLFVHPMGQIPLFSATLNDIEYNYDISDLRISYGSGGFVAIPEPSCFASWMGMASAFLACASMSRRTKRV